MKIKMLQSIGGPQLTAVAEEEVEVEDGFGVRLCDKGLAVPVREARTERTTKKSKEVERATK